MSRRIYSFFLIIASTVLLVSYSASGQTRSTALGNSSGAQDYVVSARLNQPYFDWLNEDDALHHFSGRARRISPVDKG
jgi:hypothetical protein